MRVKKPIKVSVLFSLMQHEEIPVLLMDRSTNVQKFLTDKSLKTQNKLKLVVTFIIHIKPEHQPQYNNLSSDSTSYIFYETATLREFHTACVDLFKNQVVPEYTDIIKSDHIEDVTMRISYTRT